jgi:hypothetical protein
MEPINTFGYTFNNPVTTRSLARSYLLHEGYHNGMLDALKKEYPLTEKNRDFWREFHRQLQELKSSFIGIGYDREQIPEMYDMFNQKIQLIKDLIP